MGRLVFFVALVFAVAGFNAGCSGKGDDDMKDVPALSIKDVQNDPLAFVGKIRINGVASAFSEDDGTYFTVMDTTELMTCKNLYCGAYALPAKYKGKLPELADLIDMVGSFVETDTGFYFEAASIEVRRNIMNLLVFSNPGGAE